MKLVSIEKDQTIIIDKKLELFLNPDFIYIPINNKIYVEQNAYVYKNEILTGKDKFLLSSVSGEVIGINNEKYIVIENDFREKAKSINKEKKSINIESILNALEKNDEYLFNLFRSLTSCDNIVINALADEPYVINNMIILRENISDILDMIDNLSIIYKSNNNMVVIKNNESDIIDDCLNTIGTYPNINLNLVNDEYLLSKKYFLLNRLKVNVNKTLFLNIKELVKLIDLIKYNHINTTKIITISGNAINMGKVIKVKKYTRLKDILNKYIEFTTDDYVLIANSLINGYEVNDNVVITDEINSIHIMKKIECSEEDCINCGKCISVCPEKIDIVRVLREKTYDKKCIECGICSYVCPSKISLIEKVKGVK